MRRGALVGLVALLLAVGSILRFRETHRTPVAPLGCRDAVSLVEPTGERLACLSNPALRGCPSIRPGFRYRECQRLGPIPGAILMLRGSPLSLSAATESDLIALPGIGPTLASKIVVARQTKPLCRLEDVAHISGIGAKRAQSMAPYLVFDDVRCPATTSEIR